MNRRPMDDEVIANLFARAYDDTGNLADAFWVVESIVRRQVTTCDVGAARLNELIEHVGKVRGIAPKKILGPSRVPAACLARFEVWYKARQIQPALSYEALGHAFDRDHSTVMHGVAKFEEHMAASAELRARVGWEVAQWQRAA